MIAYSVSYHAFRHVYRTLGAICLTCSIASNLVPPSKLLHTQPKAKAVYEFLILMLAAFAVNWRACLPSLDMEIAGFRVHRIHHPETDSTIEECLPEGSGSYPHHAA